MGLFFCVWVIFSQFLTQNHSYLSFLLYFILINLVFSSLFCHMSVVLCWSSTYVALFDFLSCCDVPLERSTIQSMIWSSTLQIRDIDISVNHIICRYFVIVYY